jgi:hypothetical protein
VNDIRAAKKAGNRPVGGAVMPIVVVAAPGDPGKGILVNSVIQQGAGMTYGPDGVLVATGSPNPHLAVDAVLVWVSSRWAVGGVEVKS